MLKQYQHFIGNAFRVVDAFVLSTAWILAYYFRFTLPIFPPEKGLPSVTTYASLLPLVIVLWSMVFTGFRVYRPKRMLRRTHEAHLILKAHGFALLLFVTLTYIFSEYKYSRGVILYFGVLGGFFLVLFRLLLRNSLRAIRRRGYNLRHVLLVGEGPSTEMLLTRFEKFPELGIRPLGIVTQTGRTDQTILGKPILGGFESVGTILQQERPDEIIIALPRHQYAELDRILSYIRDESIGVRIIPDVHEYVTLGCEIEDFDGLPIVNINETPLSGWSVYAKRWTDAVCSLLALIVLAPIMFLIAVAIKLTSRGPVLYAQERMGLDGKKFKMYKFRSMQINAENQTGAVWAQKNDPRRTPIGSVLRSTSLDELPQLWNVFVGDMSLVGPRPERPVFVEKFRKEIPHYMLRHRVKAGITGWAQINGWRGDTSLSRRIECDLFYIRNWSYLLDLKILLMTVWRGFINKNAY